MEGGRTTLARSSGSNNVDSIVQMAFSLFRERGYEATSIDLIAKHVGITKGAIYHHVRGKEAILAIGVNRALDALLAVLEEPEAVAGVGTPSERFRFILRRSIEVELANLDEVTVLLRLRGNTPTEREALAKRRAFDRAVAGVVREAIANGEMRRDIDLALITRLIFGMVNWLTEWYRPDGPIGSDQVIEAVIGFVISGVSPAGVATQGT